MRPLLLAALWSVSDGYAVNVAGAQMRVSPVASVNVNMLAASTDSAAVTKASSSLLAEISKDSRSLASIENMVTTIESTGRNTKIRKAVLGEWKIVFATDEEAVKPFAAGGGDGPFAVLEDVFLRLLSGYELQTIEVVRKIGPFGNMAQSLYGKFDLTTGDDSDSLSWKPTYMVNERGREVDAPNGAAKRMEWVVSHVSKELLVLRRATNAKSYVVCTRLGKGKLNDELEEACVDAEQILGLVG